jgi:hypothetical protein
MEIWMWSEHIHNVGVVVLDGPHIFEIHTLRGTQLISLQRNRARLTKYPVSKVSGKNTTVHNVNRRLYGRSLTDSMDNTTNLRRTSLHSFRRMPSKIVVLQHQAMKIRTRDLR